ncbi:MAG TPA: penicillin-binding protein activator [Stellaceae bacterium]|nr:penicillin-binding protein activator [Stellaceae bacterium]
MLRPGFPRRYSRLALAAALLILGSALGGCTSTRPRPAPTPQLRPPAPAASAPVTVTPGPAEALPANGTKLPVALLLPLSGPSAGIGNAMLDAAQMALFDIPDNRIELVVRDSGGTAAMAATAARSAIAAGAKLILGPLLAGEVEAVQPIARSANVAVVAFSTATQLAGGGTWLMSFDPRQEIARVVIYAHQHGHDRFAALAPSSPYGDVAVATLRDAAQIAGATVARVSRYDPRASNLAPAVDAFAAGGADFDALLIAEGGAKLKALAAQLPFDNIDPDRVKFLGTGLWADPGLGAEPALDGAWFAAPDPQTRADFEARYKDLYHGAPPLLATLGYDATALAAVLARSGDFSAAALTNPSGFSGLNGIFRLLPDGIVERGLAVLEVRRTGTTVVDPAPQTFQRPTY